MSRRLPIAFLLVVLAQTSHSVEEYVARLYAVFPPARFVSSLFSDDLAMGFVIANTLIIAFGFWCWAVPVARQWPVARGLAWGWAAVELANGTGHSVLALGRLGYFPGVVTAPLLLASGAWLAVTLARGRQG